MSSLIIVLHGFALLSPFSIFGCMTALTAGVDFQHGVSC